MMMMMNSMMQMKAAQVLRPLPLREVPQTLEEVQGLREDDDSDSSSECRLSLTPSHGTQHSNLENEWDEQQDKLWEETRCPLRQGRSWEPLLEVCLGKRLVQ